MTLKQLYLRLDCLKYTSEQVQNIKSFFDQFYKEVIILDIEKQKQNLEALIEANPSKIFVSLDKFLPLDHNIDVSRVHDIEANYLHHVIKYNGKHFKDNSVVLYDHDIINGIGFKFAESLLNSQGCSVESFAFINLTKEEAKEIEILDFADFTEESGLVISMIDNKDVYYLKRFPYHHNKEILYKKASIYYDDYLAFSTGLNKLLEDLK